MSFLKSVLSTIVGLMIFFFIGGILMVGIISAMVAVGSSEAPKIESNSVLYIPLSGIIKERVAEDPFAELFPESSQKAIPLLKTIEAITSAKDDDMIKGIYMEHGYLTGGSAGLNEIRSAIEDFKTSGKFVYSYAEYMAEGNYYVASVADQIYLNPIGALELNGLTANVTFVKGLFDKLGIEAQIFRVGTYKSAVEPFMRKDMSEANREQLSALINDVYSNYVEQIATSRGLEIARLNEISNKMLVREPEDALEYGLVTSVAYENEVKDALRNELGIEADAKINFYNINDYIQTLSSGYSSDRVAVIVAEGEIVSGQGDMENVGSEKFVKAIRDARESKRVKAVVIRINSPGGSMLASDVMWKEIMLTKEVKPVIASMSSVAASGGYYMAMPCDTIVAQPMTITGSIGVFGMLPNFEQLLEDKLGITNDGVSTGEFSNIYRVSSGLNDQEKQIIQTSVENAYEIFTQKAAEGRNMPQDDIKAVASGRVWTGNQAHQHGLVDILGGYQDALDIAAEAAGIKDKYQVTFYPPLKTKWEELFGNIAEEVEGRMIKSNYGHLAPYVEQIKSLEKYEGILARMPIDLEIK